MTYPLFDALANSLNLGPLSSSSPIAMMLMNTMFFFSCFTAFTNTCLSAHWSVDPMNKTMCCSPFLLRLFFKVKAVTCMNTAMSTAPYPITYISPQSGTLCKALKIFPKSFVGKTNTSSPNDGPAELRIHSIQSQTNVNHQIRRWCCLVGRASSPKNVLF